MWFNEGHSRPPAQVSEEQYGLLGPAAHPAHASCEKLPGADRDQSGALLGPQPSWKEHVVMPPKSTQGKRCVVPANPVPMARNSYMRATPLR